MATCKYVVTCKKGGEMQKMCIVNIQTSHWISAVCSYLHLLPKIQTYCVWTVKTLIRLCRCTDWSVVFDALIWVKNYLSLLLIESYISHDSCARNVCYIWMYYSCMIIYAEKNVLVCCICTLYDHRLLALQHSENNKILLL